MARPKKSVPMAQVGWRIPAHLVDWARSEAERLSIDPGAWLTGVLQREKDGPPRGTAAPARPVSLVPRTAVTGRDQPINPRPKARDAK